MLDYVLHAQRSNLHYLKSLVKDIRDDQMTAQPVSGITLNHPAWILGHIAGAADFALVSMGAKGVAPASWNALFMPGTKPQNDAQIYPKKAELIAVIELAYQRVAQTMPTIAAATWALPFPLEKMRPYWPTLGDGVFYLVTAHDAAHLGQLSAWRRAMGMPSVM